MHFEPNFNVPPDCGRRLLPAVLDETALKDPERVFISVPRSSADISKGFEDITYGTFARAVDKFAHWLRLQVDHRDGPKVILYFGPTDIRYLLAILGCAKAGHIAFFSSHRNSIEAHKSIAERAGCEIVLVPDDAPAMLDQLLKVKPLAQVQTPATEYFFQDLDQVEPIPFNLKWEDAKDKPFCVLHTSGSTGIPKPVFVTYGTFACNDAHQLIPSFGGKPTLVNFLQGKRYFVALPLFHAASLTFTIGYNIFAGVVTVIPPTGPLTASVVNQVFTYGRLDGALLAPSLIVDCYNNNEYCVSMVQKLKFLSYVGGALPEEVGNVLTTRVKLMTLMGSCETALHPLEINDDPADWQYLTFSKYLGHYFREDRDGYHELMVKKDPKYEVFQGVFSTFPQKEEFGSGDLFQQHPTRSESWLFRARTDDIIAFTTAEKLNPITMESVISANPLIKSALIGGQGKFQAALLVEPHVYPKSKDEEEQYIKDIWPSVLQANRDCPAHGRIMKGFVMITNPLKPIPRAGKETVQRHAALKLYADEFEQLYAKMRPQSIEPEGAQAEQTKSAAPAIANAADNLDARIEAALARLLPAALEAAMKSVLSNMLLGLGHVQPAQTTSSIRGPVDSLTNGITNGYTNGHTNGLTNSTTNGVSNHLSNGHSIGHTKDLTNGIVQQVREEIQPTPGPIQVNGPTYKVTDDLPSNIRQIIYTELAENLDVSGLTDQDDLFKHGLDSLQLHSLITTLNAFLIKAKPGVPLLKSKQIYANPTVAQIVGMVGA